MVLIIAGLITAFTLTYFLLPFVIRVAHKNSLYDLPDERKLHNQQISSLGGVAIFIGVILSTLLVADSASYNTEFQYILAAFFVIFLVGVIDDLFCLKAWKKILGQLLATAMLTFKGGLLISSLHGFLGLHELSYAASIGVSFFTILLLINAFNLIDGVDGLAGSLGLAASLFFGIVFLVNNALPAAVLSFAMCGALLGFLMYNFPPAKIFMGDSGSTIIGLMCAILAIKFIENPFIQTSFSNSSVPAIAFGFLLIPLMDVLRVFALRIAKRQSPLAPDRNHFHHLLQSKGLTHLEVTTTLAVAQVLFAVLGLLLHPLNINLVVAIEFAVYFGAAFVLTRYIPVRKKMHIVRDALPENVVADVKIYPIYKVKEKVSVRED